MRRFLFAGIGVAAVLIFAACSPDQPRQEPLAPADVGLAKGGGGGGGSQCSGGLAADIAKLQDDLYSGAAETLIEARFDAIKGACPLTAGDPILMSYLETMINESGAPAGNANGLVDLLGKVTLYATGAALVRPASIFQTQGGAAVLSVAGDRVMTTWNNQARLEIQAGTTPAGPHLWTFEPRQSAECDGTTSLRITGNCYQVHDYPDETVAYDDPFIVTLCHPSSAGPGGSAGIGHESAAFNGRAEVLQEVLVNFGCAHSTAAIDSWLGRKAGPLGRAVAKAYDYLRPQPLFADDAGESGLGLFTSLYGSILNDIVADNFDDAADFNDGVDVPDLGDTWTINASSPGFIQQQDALGGLSGGIVVLSQAQGNCNNCPVFRLLATRVNSSESETVGTYEVTWQSSQTKPNVKEAPFVILNASGAEIARLAYVTQSSQNKLVFTVAKPGPDDVFVVANGWTENVPQSFKITVNLTVLGTNDNTVSFAYGPLAGPLTTVVTNTTAPNANSLKQVGYVLTGIDAGIIASDNWKVTRLSDVPPQ